MRVTLEKPVEEQLIELLNQPGGYEPLGHLIGINPENLTTAGKIDYLAALEKQNSWLTSLIQRATLAIAGSEPSESSDLWEGVDESEREDVATALRLSSSTAQIRIDVARVLTNHLPATCEALANGDISPSHATLIARESTEAIKRGISTEDLLIIENKALAHAEFHTPAQVGRKLRTLFAQASPESFEEKVVAARDTRSVRMYPEGDGMATLIALLPIEDAQTVMLSINSLISMRDRRSCSLNSKEDFGNHQSLDNRNIEMKRADALAEICGDLLARISDDYQPHRRPVSINITMDLPTALGLADNPAELNGYGPIPASVARQLSSDAKWRKFITDPGTGNLLSLGRESYMPSQSLVDFLTARDRTCRFPGCSQPARVSDIDHAIPWEEGGQTSPENLGLLCRRHHRMKTHDGWHLESFADGSCRWISPAGKEFIVPARPIHESA
ncbi:MAG: DUF222 domain-containing protein [Candidatus Nanopelagicaceae bacterium]|nr:DUF222 domain-containing protein [Candidatus Nanopelagicaceae bacterium]